MLSNEDVARRILIYSGQVHAAAGMSGWCFNHQKNLLVTTSSHEEELHSVLKASACLDYAFDHYRSSDKPFVLSDSLGLVWLGEFSNRVDAQDLLFLFGPVFLNYASVSGLESNLQNMHLSVSMRSGIVQILHNIPVVPLSTLINNALMLHFTMTEEDIKSNDILFQTSPVDSKSKLNPANLERYSSDQVRTVEQMLLQFVREGNTNYYKIWEQVVAPTDASDDFETGNPIREMKDELLIFTALCSRAAIEGGLPASTAKSLENKYIGEIESANTATDLISTNSKMMDDFVTRVQQTHANPQISQTVNQCFDFIDANLLRDFTLDELAAAVGYTKYYLSKKFAKETGISLNEYIKKRRIDQAKIWLLTTGRKIQDISDDLHFGTRNYFSKVFFEQVGLTPAAYRAKRQSAVEDDQAER